MGTTNRVSTTSDSTAVGSAIVHEILSNCNKSFDSPFLFHVCDYLEKKEEI